MTLFKIGNHCGSLVILSAAKDLSRWAARCFATLSMTLPALVVKVHNRLSTDCRVRIYPARGFPLYSSIDDTKVLLTAGGGGSRYREYSFVCDPSLAEELEYAG